MTKIEFDIPIRTISEANSSEHWTKKSKRHKSQQFFVNLAFNLYVKDCKLPCKITITRFAPGELDHQDNLRMALKWVVDQISECIALSLMSDEERKNHVIRKGQYDDDPRMTWEYKQEKSKYYSVRICIEF